MPREASSRRMTANRRNAQRSTGPRSGAGKAVVRANAVRHALTADVVVRAGAAPEDGGAFTALLDDLYDTCRPVGPIEQALVETLALCRWRLLRAARAERGTIELSVQRVQNALREHRCWREQVARRCLPSPMAQAELLNGTRGIRYVREVLGEASANLGTSDGLAAAHATVLQHLGIDLTGRDAAETLRWLQAKQAELTAHDKQVVADEQRADEAALARASLPASAVLDRFLRYESAAERRFYRALAELERQQRRRQGEAVPPPLSVALSDGQV